MRARSYALLALIAGCEPGERAVLIDVHTQADVTDLRVLVVSLESPRVWSEPPEPIQRTAEDINADPIRVVVELPQSDSILVQIEASGEDADGAPVRLVATRCYDVDGVIRDEVELVVIGADGDFDGFVTDPMTVCREPATEEMPERACDDGDYVCPIGRAADCDDANAAIHPGAGAVCLDGIDDDCDADMDEACADNDGDGSDSCPAMPTGECDCNDNVSQIHPGATDVCNDRIDQDCSGADECCNADMDGFVVCSFPTMEAQDCDDTEASVFPGAPEICDRLDNNCNGRRDELDECRGDDLDEDGAPACNRVPGPDCDCNDCDAGIHAGAREVCGNGVDEDCDSMADEACPSPDADGDGYGPNDCRDDDPFAFPHLMGEVQVDRCDDGMASTCVPGDPDTSCADDRDGDGFVEPPECEDNAEIVPGSEEVCDGIDNDCDGVVDEVLDASGTRGCGLLEEIFFDTFFTDCGACRNACDLASADACEGGVCICSASGAACDAATRCCRGGCIDASSDPDNCGACERACGTDETCVSGECRCGDGPGCAAPLSCCGGRCVDFATDESNCGGCGDACGVNTVCTDGACGCVPPGAQHWEDCEGGVAGCETDTNSALDDCGQCNQRCAPANATGLCGGGACMIAACNGSTMDCNGSVGDGCEVDLTSDEAHCGACGVACALGETCTGGQCTCGLLRMSGGPACGGGSNACCGSACTNVANDENNCGSCGNTCIVAFGIGACVDGSCGLAGCNPGRADCNSDGTDCETDTNTSESHCGGCGMSCASGASCSAGTCRCSGTGDMCYGMRDCSGQNCR